MSTATAKVAAKNGSKRKRKPPALMHNVVGEVEMRPLDEVVENDWNPNKFTPHQYASLREGFVQDGWLKNQSLLVWVPSASPNPADRKKWKHDVIIDGEHRYKVAKELGWGQGPMVMLRGITEVAAKALTIKMDAKRGTFDLDELGVLVRSIHDQLDVPDIGLSLGFSNESLMGMLEVPAMDLEGRGGEGLGDSGGATLPGVHSSHVKMVQLFFQETTHAEFQQLVSKFGKRFNQANVTDTVMEALRALAAAE